MSCISSFTWSLFTFKVAKFSARLADDDIEESFFVSTNRSLLDSPHILHQLRYMLS